MKNIDVTIENFGKIQHAQFQVKPFTVIAGKNASGKSFIARALYSVFNTLNKDHFSIEVDEALNSIEFVIDYMAHLPVTFPRHIEEDLYDIKNCFKSVSTNVDMIFHRGTLVSQLVNKGILIPDIQRLKRSVELAIIDAKVVEDNARLLAPLDLMLPRVTNMEHLIDSTESALAELFEKQLQQALIGDFQVISTNRLKNKNCDEKEDVNIGFGEDLGHLKITKTDFQSKFQTVGIDEFQQIDNVVYLESPIYWKIKDVLKGWVHEQNNPSHRRQRKHQQNELKKIPQYILDTFALLDVDVIQDEVHEDLVKLKHTINKCIGGQIQISQSGDLQFISQNKTGESFGVDLNQTASGTTSLGLISLLLEKNVIVPNSVLIMDEPEVNLHPAWQQVMIQVLYQLSISGVKIIMASHSFDMMETIEKMMELHEEKGLDVGEHFSVVQLDDGNTINQDKPIFKKLDAVKADLGMPLYNLFADK
jgi:predicted ATP-dependent endonuclease of OLD family